MITNRENQKRDSFRALQHYIDIRQDAQANLVSTYRKLLGLNQESLTVQEQLAKTIQSIRNISGLTQSQIERLYN